jgi:hypothetical protein
MADGSEYGERLERIKIKARERLRRMKKADLLRLWETLGSESSIPQLADTIRSSFSPEDIVKALLKVDKSKGMLFAFLEEPKREADLKPVVTNYLKGLGYTTVLPEIPLPKVGKARPAIVDLLAYKPGWGGGEFHGVELKTSATRGAIRSAFQQAEECLKHLDRSSVVFSPYVFLNYADVIDSTKDGHENVGVLVAMKGGAVVELSSAYKTRANRATKNELIDRHGFK